MEPGAAQDEPVMIVLSAANIWVSLNFNSATMEQQSVGARGEAPTPPHPHPRPPHSPTPGPPDPRPPLMVNLFRTLR